MRFGPFVKPARVAAAVAAIAGVAGCARDLPTVKSCDFRAFAAAMDETRPARIPRDPGEVDKVTLSAVSLVGPGRAALMDVMVVEGVTARRTESGGAEVQARLVNCGNQPLQVLGRTHFLDRGQGAAEPVTAWERIHLPAGGMAAYRTRSIGRQEVDSFLIELSENR